MSFVQLRIANNRLEYVTGLPGKGWAEFTQREADTVRDLRNGIQALATETGLEIGEYRQYRAHRAEG